MNVLHKELCFLYGVQLFYRIIFHQHTVIFSSTHIFNDLRSVIISLGIGSVLK